MSARRQTWRVEGMRCVHCEGAVARAASALPGIGNARCSYRRGTLTADWDPELCSPEALDAALREAGYGLRRGGAGTTAARLAAFAAVAAFLFYLLTASPLANLTRAFPTAREGMGYGALLLLGLTTSLHCVAMCGGICLSRSSAGEGRRGVLRGAALYNLGRAVSYAATGAVLGALCGLLSISNGVRAGLQIALALMMLAMALNLSGVLAGHRLGLRLPRGLAGRVDTWGQGRSSLCIGLLNGLMPCGPLQAMQVVALASGSAVRGALSMFCFALGTIPLMLGFGLVGGGLNRRFGAPMRLASAALVLAMGLSALASGLSLAGVSLGAADGGAAAQLEQDVQYVYTELDYGSYPPITVRAGVPVKWNLHADSSRLNGCNGEIVIPDLGLHVALMGGDNWIEFTPEEPGVIAYSCWMGMIRSSITVTEE